LEGATLSSKEGAITEGSLGELRWVWGSTDFGELCRSEVFGARSKEIIQKSSADINVGLVTSYLDFAPSLDDDIADRVGVILVVAASSSVENKVAEGNIVWVVRGKVEVIVEFL
jgi:hypothetical protein